MNARASLKFACGFTVAAFVTTTSAQIVFYDDFDVNSTANWTVNQGPSDGVANFFFDYSTVGIPSAPNSIGGTTRGLKLQANLTGGVFGGLSVSPTGQSFLGDYTLRFDMWMNFQGGATGGLGAGGSGTTQGAGAGIGTAGTTPQWAGGAHDSLQFSMTGDGGSAQDYRVYPVAGLAGTATGYYAAGTATDARNDTHPYYQALGSKTAPAAQLALYPAEQTGTTRPGAAGFAWRDVEITKSGNIVTWTMDGLLMATVDASSLTFGGNNILFQYFDTNGTVSSDPSAAALLFGLVDNVSVTLIPEPTSAALLVLGGGVCWLLRRRK